MEYITRRVYVDNERYECIKAFKDRAEIHWTQDMPENWHLKVRLIGVKRESPFGDYTEGFEFDEMGLFNFGAGATFKIVLGLLSDNELKYYNMCCAPEDRDLAGWFCNVKGFYKSDWKWLEV